VKEYLYLPKEEAAVRLSTQQLHWDDVLQQTAYKRCHLPSRYSFLHQLLVLVQRRLVTLFISTVAIIVVIIITIVTFHRQLHSTRSI
jgi:hypothetical protein